MSREHIEKIKKLDLVEFEKALQDMDFRGKEFAEVLYKEIKPVTLSNEELQCFYYTAKKASYEKALVDARKNLSSIKLPLGRLIQFLRDKSGLSQIDIAKVLKKEESYIENLENGQINPLKLPVTDIADIMELFKITLSEFLIAINKFIALSTLKPNKVNVMARSSTKVGTKERGDSLSHAMDAALLEIAKKNKQIDKIEVEIDKNYIENLKKTLRERGSANLLK